MACAPRASAPLVAAVTEATTASRFFLEWALASFRAARVFSTPSLKAVFEAAVNWSTVDFTASAAAAMGISGCGCGLRRGGELLFGTGISRGEAFAASFNDPGFLMLHRSSQT